MSKRFTIRRRVIWKFIFLNTVLSCKDHHKGRDCLIQSYKCVSIFQFVDADTNLISLDGELIVSSYDGWKIYQSLKPNYIFSDSVSNTSDTVYGILGKVINNYITYIKKDKDSTGFEFDENNIRVNKVIDFSEFKQRHEILNFNNFYNNQVDSFVATRESLDSLLEVYVPRSIYKKDISYPDTSYFTFRKSMQNRTDFSFSTDLEKKHKMWLYSVKMLYNTVTPQNGKGRAIPDHSFMFTLYDTKINCDFFDRLIKRLRGIKTKEIKYNTVQL